MGLRADGVPYVVLWIDCLEPETGDCKELKAIESGSPQIE